jgi:hypothetical protein
MRKIARTLLVAAALLAVAGCGGDAPEAQADQDAGDHPAVDASCACDATVADADVPAEDAAPAADAQHFERPVTIVVVGDPTPPDPHLTGSQTPRDYVMGISRLELLKSIDDATPALGFDLGNGTLVPMDGTTTVGTVELAEVPPASYTYVKVKLTEAKFTVAATAHAGFDLPGNVTLTVALSDTVIEGTAWPKGKGHFDFMGLVAMDITVPPGSLPASNGVTIVEDATSTSLILPMPSPLVVTPDPADDPSSGTITFLTGDAFTWTDLDEPSNTIDVWDVSQQEIEPVTGMGARRYTVAFE